MAEADEDFTHNPACSAIKNGYDFAYQCWTCPNSLFLVNKEVRQLAEYLFYSRNNFVLYCAEPELRISTESWERIPRNHLHRIRYITVRLFDPFLAEAFLDWWKDDLGPWIKKFEFIAQHFQLERLTLVVDLDCHPCYLYCFEPYKPYSDSDRWALYPKLIEPMTALKGLQNLFVQIVWPGMKNREQVEQDLERVVMGQDYDSFARGKKRRVDADNIGLPAVEVWCNLG